MKKKIAIFDIDKTIIKKDSMFLFLIYGLRKRPLTAFNLFKVLFNIILYKIKLIKTETAKESFFMR